MTPSLVSLVTSSSSTVSGGHLYNQRMVGEADRHGSLVDLIPVEGLTDLSDVDGQIVVDSLVAAEVVRMLPLESGTLAALVHQAPGGQEGSLLEKQTRRLADLSLYRKCGLVMAASSYLEDLLIRAGVSRNRIEVVAPGCDIANFDPTSHLDLRRGKKLALLNVANWLPNKGILDLLDAIEPIPSNEVVLHLVGSRDLDRRYTSRIEARLRKLRNKVVVHGPVPSEVVARMYAAADAFVITSHNEGYATVVAEALCFGLPVLGWGVGNIPNLVRDGREGRLFETGETTRLREAIRLLAWDAELRSALARGAANRGRDLPTWQETGDQFFGALDRMGA